LDDAINDNKYGHATEVSILQRDFGPLATPFMAAVDVGYEIFTIFFPGHTQENPVTLYQELTPTRRAPFYGFFDGQHPLNWLYDTPGDILGGHLIGHISGLLLSPTAAPYLNRAGFLMPGPNYAGKPESAYTKLATPGAAWPW